MRRAIAVLTACAAAGGTAAVALAQTPVAPTATTGAASGVTQHEATVSGTVVPGGSDASVQFEYGTSSSYGLTTAAQTLAAGPAPAPVSARLGGLTTSTTYHYRVVATNAAGTSRGADRSFRTAAAPRPPAVATRGAQDVTRDAATLTAGVDPNGLATRYVFQYGTSRSYTAQTAPADAGSGGATVPVAQRIGALRPYTTYHYRVVATNAAGVARGRDRTVRTAAIPLSFDLHAGPEPVPYGRAVVIQARLSGSGAARRSVRLQAKPYPYRIDWRQVGGARRTNSKGVATFFVPPFTSTSHFRVVAGPNAASRTIRVRVRPRVTLRFRRASHHRVRLSGTVRPATVHGRVSIQRRTASGRWVPVRRVKLHRDRGVLRYRTTFGRHAHGVVRAVLPPRDGLVTGRSAAHRLPRGR